MTSVLIGPQTPHNVVSFPKYALASNPLYNVLITTVSITKIMDDFPSTNTKTESDVVEAAETISKTNSNPKSRILNRNLNPEQFFKRRQAPSRQAKFLMFAIQTTPYQIPIGSQVSAYLHDKYRRYLDTCLRPGFKNGYGLRGPTASMASVTTE